MASDTIWQWLENSSVGSFVASSDWAFPTLETIHVIAIVTVVGTITIMDLRLLGVASRDRSVSSVSRNTLPLTWGAFCFALLSGSLLFVSKATSYTINPWFLSKLALLVLAAVNMGVFHVVTWKSIARWDLGMPPLGARIAGGTSLALWAAILFCGRLIGFTLGIYHT